MSLQSKKGEEKNRRQNNETARRGAKGRVNGERHERERGGGEGERKTGKGEEEMSELMETPPVYKHSGDMGAEVSMETSPVYKQSGNTGVEGSRDGYGGGKYQDWTSETWKNVILVMLG